MNGYTLALPYNGMLLVDKKERTTNPCNNMDGSQKHNAEQKKPDIEACTLEDSINMQLEIYSSSSIVTEVRSVVAQGWCVGVEVGR